MIWIDLDDTILDTIHHIILTHPSMPGLLSDGYNKEQMYASLIPNPNRPGWVHCPSFTPEQSLQFTSIIHDFIMSGQPIPTVIGALRGIRRLQKAGFTLGVLSARPPYTEAITRLIISRTGLFSTRYPPVVYCTGASDKKVGFVQPGDLLIDDHCPPGLNKNQWIPFCAPWTREFGVGWDRMLPTVQSKLKELSANTIY